MQDAKTLHRFLTPALLTEVLQAAGYRVTEGPDGAPILISATNGLSFEVRLFNPLAHGRKGAVAGRGVPEAPAADGASDAAPSGAAWADAAFRAAFRVEGELPLSLVNAWNVAHRFARLALAGEWLRLDMDLIALGGVLADNLRTQVEIWDHLVADLIAYLRAELPKLARPAPVAEPAPGPQAVPEADRPETVAAAN